MLDKITYREARRMFFRKGTIYLCENENRIQIGDRYSEDWSIPKGAIMIISIDDIRGIASQFQVDGDVMRAVNEVRKRVNKFVDNYNKGMEEGSR